MTERKTLFTKTLKHDTEHDPDEVISVDTGSSASTQVNIVCDPKSPAKSKPKKGKGRPVVGKGNGKKMGPMSSYHREKISKSKILSRLISHAEGTLSPAGVAGNQEMSATQVTAALSLLDRVLPKLSSTEIKADVRTEKVVNQIKIISVDPDNE